jgi:hypothetical protein
MDWVPETIFLEVKKSGREYGHSSLYSADESEWSFIFTPLYSLSVWRLIVWIAASALYNFLIRSVNNVDRNLHHIQVNSQSYLAP